MCIRDSYKPNSKNQGAAFSFSINKGKNDKPVLFVSMIQQYSWNDSRKTGSFKENAKNPEKSATTALSLIEGFFSLLELIQVLFIGLFGIIFYLYVIHKYHELKLMK